MGAYVTSYLIRKVLKCPLPIEIYYVGKEEAFDNKVPFPYTRTKTNVLYD